MPQSPGRHGACLPAARVPSRKSSPNRLLTMSAFTNRSMLHDYATKPAVVSLTTAALLTNLIDNEIAARTRTK